MIISKTPFRVSLFGGGTDLPAYFSSHGGMVINFAINKYCYIFFRHGNQLMDYNYRVVYSKNEVCDNINKIWHPSVRESAKFYKISKPFDILHNGDLPARSGLGASSSFTVGLGKIFSTLNKKNISKKKLAKNSIHIEQDMMKDYVGCQDQIAASYGGLNRINFSKNGFLVNRITLNNSYKKLINNSLFLVYVKKKRKMEASQIEKKKIKKIEKNFKHLEEIHKITLEANKSIFQSKKIDINLISKLLNESWYHKKNLSKDITNNYVDEIYQAGLNSGALAGKLCGAGGGGFLMFIVPIEKQKKFRKKFGNLCFPIQISDEGAKLLIQER